MKQLSTLFAALLFVSTAAAQDKSPLKDERDKVSYSIGLDIGSTFKKQNMDINPDTLLLGLKHGAADQGAKNLAAGEKFLEENKAKEGVKTTTSGLQYKVITEGKGESPKPSDNVSVHYRGTLTSGKEFDSSYSRNAPAIFPVNGVIPGWTEGLQLMKPGSKYQFVIPPQLAYGDRGAGGDIGPNETLLFDVELLEVNPTPPPAPQPATE
jgi:FKBP-type peptidyl-prolyl cis-trans isomerase FklB